MMPFLMILWTLVHREDNLVYPESYLRASVPAAKPLSYGINRFLKRAVDVVVSLAVILFLFPILFPVIILSIIIDSSGPIFYFQNRSSRNSKVFKIIKFRTLSVIDCDNSFKQVSKDDKRITRVGRILRKYNLDEFPQFFNVLIGDMSLVGPRPHPLKLDEAGNEYIAYYYDRLAVKPGITGWAQVNGYRGVTHQKARMRARIDHDIWYINNWSVMLDIRILFTTIINPFFGEEYAF
jgi:lipopolysaccharide/colanic/teichoic acid biosynthesis glycosyltransferase